jgi:hypothetical protein
MPGVYHCVPCCYLSSEVDPLFVPTKQADEVYKEKMTDGLFIELVNGKNFYIDRSPFDINVIASALSKLCRFNGHCVEFYSVAQHCVLVSQIMQDLDLGNPVEGLLHDGTEAYLADIPSPWKVLLPQYKEIESKLDARLREQFKLPSKITEGCKRADIIALFVEADSLMVTKGADWPSQDGIKEVVASYLESFGGIKYNWSWEIAEHNYLKAWKLYTQ